MRLSATQIEVELRAAQQAFNAGDVAKADRLISSVLASNPEHAGANFGRGMILVSQARQEEALASFVQALRADALNSDVLAWASMTSLNLGRGREAEGYARRLTRGQPQNDRAHFLLTNALSLQDRFVEALESLERCLALKPTEPDYVAGKAQILARLKWSSQAIEWFGKALKIRHAPALSLELADLLLAEGRPKEAVLVLERLNGQHPHVLLGRAYTEAQDFVSAEKQWELARNAGDDIALPRSMAEIYAGRLAIAEELLLEKIRKNPAATELYQPLTSIRKMTQADAWLIEKMQRLLPRIEADSAEERDLRYALGKAYHDLGEFREAMQSYDEANRIAYRLSAVCQGFDPAAWRAYTDFQIHFFTKERIESLASEGLDSQTPAFVLGMIRSGTTLTEQILSRHSEVDGGGESTFWPDHRSELLNERAQRFDTVSARRLGATYLKALTGEGRGAKYVTEKNPSNVMLAALLHCVFPGAKLIHIKRHPLDNLLSIWMTPIETGLPFVYHKSNLVFAYREYLRLVEHFQSVLPADRFRTFEYERLTSEPEKAIGELLAFLDLGAEEACFHPESSARTVRTPSYYQVRQPINRDSQAKWKFYEPWLGPFAELLDSTP